MPAPLPAMENPPRSPILRLLSPTSVGTLTAATFALLPARDLRVRLPLLDRYPGVVDTFSAIPYRLYAILFGFALGFGVAKGLNWTRWRVLRVLFNYRGWMTHPKGMQTKVWAMLVKALKGPAPYQTTYFQDVIPRQPLPDLNATLDRYLSIAEYLLSPEEYEVSKQSVEEFRKNEGPKLQAYLQKRTQTHDNWMSDYWLQAAYLASREPIAINNNYYLVNTYDEDKHSLDIFTRGATQVYSFARFEEILSKGDVPPALLNDLVPLCMYGYQFIFNTARIPGEHMDTIASFPGNKFVVVIRKGIYFHMDMYAPGANGKKTLLTKEEIKNQFQKICDIADTMDEPLPVAALTTQKRNIWAKQREQLMEKNRATLAEVESAMFIVVLDTHVPKDFHEHAKLVLTGHGNDRWFDKCFSSVTFGNSYCGSNVEHSVIDAMVFTTMAEYTMVREEYTADGDVIKDPRRPARNLSAPSVLNWDLQGMEEPIKSAATSFKQTADDLTLVRVNSTYGKGFMKKQRLSPDGYIQMALQLAYFRQHNKEIPKTYEPSTHRMFLMGRTETVHPGSSHSVAWMRCMDDPDVPKEQKISHLRKAIQHQTQFRLDATIGEGCDRHLLGLLCASREMGMDLPGIFRDKAWTMPFKLSTSQTPTRIYDYGADLNWKGCAGGFGPYCHDGYGICYVVLGEDLFNVDVTGWRSCPDTDVEQMGLSIHQALHDMKQLLS